MRIRFKVNGERRVADAWPGASLLFVLRDHLGLPGSKNACEQGECGSCSVWLDGDLVCSCLVLAAQAHEREVRTVESLSRDRDLHQVQEAFLVAGAVQCGLCPPGLVGDGATTWIGSSAERPATAEGAEAVDGRGTVAIPGLVNTHHHLYQVLTRVRAKEQGLFGWLTELYPVWAGIDAEWERAAAAVGLAELALSGCATTTDHHYVFPARASGLLEAEIEAAREVGLRFHPC